MPLWMVAGDGDGSVRLEIEEIAAGGRRETRKQKSPLGGDGEHNSGAKRVMVLGDDPKPRPAARMTMMRRRVRQARKAVTKLITPNIVARLEVEIQLENFDTSSGGWWHGEMEGVVGEEVGWTGDMWEGMGSITLRGLEWH
ncbi:hypothetical protein E2562_031221 [Oryza meyeriana var. granulata]|uniref:Uncharacterized protein n=1 Tax=Oryza meyeriana var. granulata TaxID=110450 RepID=A0A6G1DQC9_9ORYZ|nr:hypothetical protein E2562_031221 [Oryza meyeriana var. granulata]